MVPFDTRSPMVTSGIRIGTPPLTTRGMNEPEMKTIAGMIDRVLSRTGQPEAITNVAGEIKELCVHFPLYPNRLKG